MNKSTESEWVFLDPNFGRFKAADDLFRQYAQRLQRWLHGSRDTLSLLQARSDFIKLGDQIRREIWPTLKAAGLLLGDLVEQGWDVRIRENSVQVLSPQLSGVSPQHEKDHIRRQELIKRNAQLRTPSVQVFIRSMERKRLFKNQFVSIFSLMRDGRELASSLESASLKANGNGHTFLNVIQPYLQFVDNKSRCSYTGIKLGDIWRYFRHTWANQYNSVPGRTMMILVRDAAAPFHPVIGLAALSSPIIQMNERDRWIGWLTETFLDELCQKPTLEKAKWLVEIVDTAIDELYISDFIKDDLLTRKDLEQPSDIVINRLLEEGAAQRNAHHRFTDRNHHDALKRNTDPESQKGWEIKAKTHLFRSKRAIALAEYLRARIILNEYLDSKPTIEGLQKMLQTPDGKKVVSRIVRKAKADRVGIAMADISVCGAVAPYNQILGGKLVSMLVTSPEVVSQYKRRYKDAHSEIASSMAGRPIVRPSNLVLLGTTSLYGANSSQYNRIKIPAEYVGGELGDSLEYIRLGKSESFGTSHYSKETIDALVALVNHRKGGQRVNSIFGEGASPKLRKVREGIETLGVDSEALLKHGRKRIIYGIPLVKNLKEYLLGIQKRPQYIISPNTPNAAQHICEWWMLRWMKMRIQNANVIQAISQHTHIEPISHGARVTLIMDVDHHAISSEESAYDLR